MPGEDGIRGGLIEAHVLEFAYGTVQVLFDVDLEVRAGERLALLGTNGAGKSTLLALLSGLLKPTAGRILLDGDDITAFGTVERVALGVVMVQGGRGTFPDLTVEENLEVGLYSKRSNKATWPARIASVLDRFPVLRDAARKRAATLSGGQQQLLAIAKGLVAAPRVLLVDELTLGLAPVARDELIDIVRAESDEGTTVVLVEQNLEVAAALTERAVFLEKGSVRFEGSTSELLDRDDLARAVFFGPASR